VLFRSPLESAAMRVLLPILAFLLCTVGAGQAQTAAEFLKLGFGARTLALGDASLAADHDPSSLYWNPALLAGIRVPAAEAAHSENFGGATGFDAAAVSLPLGGRPGEAVAVGLLRFSVNDIPTTSNFRFDDVGADGRAGTGDAGEGNHQWDPGEPVETDPSAVVWRSDVEWALLAGYARPVGDRASLGLCAKYIRQQVADHQSSGLGVDIGARALLGDGLEAAARISDLTSTRLVWDTGTRETVPPALEASLARTVRFGSAATMRVLVGAGSSSWDLTGAAPRREWHGGVEYGYRESLFLRAGTSSGELAFGAGLGLKAFRLDYATVPFHELGATHRVSALARW
jgi:hypothetical protein